MKKFHINSMTGGWFVGKFSPSAFQTDACEVSYKTHKKNEPYAAHVHKIATEINYLIKGHMTIQKTELREGDIFVIKPGEIADPHFLEDCELIVVKVPSVPGDKYETL